jgi:RNA polymerase sigma-70 factor (ECF subfamily)
LAQDSSHLTAQVELRQIAAAQQDRRAFAPLYDAYVDLVWRYAKSRLGTDERAADATSATFQRALAALPAFRPERRGDITTFRSWLMTIARNVVIDEARRAGSSISLEGAEADLRLVDPGRSPEEQAIAREEQRRISAALARLPDTQRQIVELRMIGMKSIEIAGMLDMSLSAVKTAHFRAVARLRDLLAERDEERGPE